MKVGDLVQSKHRHKSIGLVLEILDAGRRVRLQWIDTLDIDVGGISLFHVISKCNYN